MFGDAIITGGIILIALVGLFVFTEIYEAAEEKAEERRKRKARVWVYRAKAEKYRKEVFGK